ncbi:microsomal glutathione S-transferase 2-like protein [Cricetulus griseus]|uniref:Microsomal glutathione S-transferase 2-like protein n=1 Tax=Cricetulus griseus TaxID=10029 RepID=A0A061IG76_CRIGR|nr:microsomal glutathione S-transferase 2-like protein [Cricetulus griseus]
MERGRGERYKNNNKARVNNAAQRKNTFLAFFATCLGLVYIYARHKYFWGYAETTDGRITGFKLSLGVLALLIVLAVLGLASRFLDEYLDLHVAKKLRHPF